MNAQTPILSSLSAHDQESIRRIYAKLGDQDTLALIIELAPAKVKPAKTTKKSAAQEIRTPSNDLVVVEKFYIERDWTWAKLSRKPSQKVIDALVKLGGKFAGKRESWAFKTHLTPATFTKATGLAVPV